MKTDQKEKKMEDTARWQPSANQEKQLRTKAYQHLDLEFPVSRTERNICLFTLKESNTSKKQ